MDGKHNLYIKYNININCTDVPITILYNSNKYKATNIWLSIELLYV